MKKPFTRPIKPPITKTTGTNSHTGRELYYQEVEQDHRREADDSADRDVDAAGDHHKGEPNGDDPDERRLLEQGHDVAQGEERRAGDGERNSQGNQQEDEK